MPRRKGSRNKSKFINVTLKQLNEVFEPDVTLRVDAAYGVIIAKGEPSDLSELTPSVIRKLSSPQRKEEHVAIRKLEFSK